MREADTLKEGSVLAVVEAVDVELDSGDKLHELCWPVAEERAEYQGSLGASCWGGLMGEERDGGNGDERE